MNHTSNAPPSAGPQPNNEPPAEAAGARVLVIVAHPDLRSSHVNRRLMTAAQALTHGAAAGRVEVRDLYRLYPDFDIDVEAEQAAVARADLIVWQHPIQWYAMPALMKVWLDEVFSHGWAYGSGGRAGVLAGKSLWLVVSTGAHEDAYRPTGYNRYFFDAFLPPYEQTAALCGLRFLPPLILHGAHTLAAAELAAHAEVYTRRLVGWPAPEHWPELEDMTGCPDCIVPGDDRPARANAELRLAASAAADADGEAQTPATEQANPVSTRLIRAA
ncbi:MAG: NAD(P)H-dependent oxidoreductase [Burkholderiales bacterium]|nr:NAD(P)H-dependent oxidoreductase [Burkholderiales bacterium]